MHTGYTVPGRFEDVPSVGPMYLVSPNYLVTLGASIIQGRGLTERDNQIDAPPVAVVNRSFAKQFFRSTETVGQRINLKNEKLFCVIVGVVEDMKNGGLGDNRIWLSKPPVPTLFLPYALLPETMYESPWDLGRTMFLTLRTTGDPRLSIA